MDNIRKSRSLKSLREQASKIITGEHGAGASTRGSFSADSAKGMVTHFDMTTSKFNPQDDIHDIPSPPKVRRRQVSTQFRPVSPPDSTMEATQPTALAANGFVFPFAVPSAVSLPINSHPDVSPLESPVPSPTRTEHAPIGNALGSPGFALRHSNVVKTSRLEEQRVDRPSFNPFKRPVTFIRAATDPASGPPPEKTRRRSRALSMFILRTRFRRKSAKVAELDDDPEPEPYVPATLSKRAPRPPPLSFSTRSVSISSGAPSPELLGLNSHYAPGVVEAPKERLQTRGGNEMQRLEKRAEDDRQRLEKRAEDDRQQLQKSIDELKTPTPPPKDTVVNNEAGRLQPLPAQEEEEEAGPSLDVSIPKTKFDRYSVMFAKVLVPTTEPDVPELRQQGSASLSPVAESPVTEDKRKPRRLSAYTTPAQAIRGRTIISLNDRPRAPLARLDEVGVALSAPVPKAVAIVEPRKAVQRSALASNPPVMQPVTLLTTIRRPRAKTPTEMFQAAAAAAAAARQAPPMPEKDTQVQQTSTHSLGRSGNRTGSTASSEESLPATPTSSDGPGYVAIAEDDSHEQQVTKAEDQERYTTRSTPKLSQLYVEPQRSVKSTPSQNTNRQIKQQGLRPRLVDTSSKHQSTMAVLEHAY